MDNTKASVNLEVAETQAYVALRPTLECLPELGPVAREEWYRVVPALDALGILNILDRATLAMYCNAYEQWLHAQGIIQRFGPIVKSPHDYPVQSPYVSIARKAEETMLRIATEFGFTPASRRKIVPPISNSELQPFDIAIPPMKKPG